MNIFQHYFSHGKPLEHYFHHFLFANIGLFIAYMAYGSITFWEIMLFLFMSFIPLLDELSFVALTYIKNKESREIVNFLLVGEMIELLSYLHDKRVKFEQLFLHNIPMYLGLCALLYIFLAFDLSLFFYGLAAIVAHLALDIINDQYELKSVSSWLWPFSVLINGK